MEPQQAQESAGAMFEQVASMCRDHTLDDTELALAIATAGVGLQLLMMALDPDSGGDAGSDVAAVVKALVGEPVEWEEE